MSADLAPQRTSSTAARTHLKPRFSRSARRPAVLTMLLVLIGALLAPAASAHDILVSSDPRDGQKVAASHRSFVLTFSKPLQPFGAELVYEDAQGKQTELEATITTDQVRADYGKNLPLGQGSLKWRVVSSDGHPIEGVIAFTVTDPSTPASAASATAAAAQDQNANKPAEKKPDPSKINLPLLILGSLAVLTGITGSIVGYRLRKNGR